MQRVMPARRFLTAVLAAVVAALLVGALPAAGQPPVAVTPLDYGFQGEGGGRLEDADLRRGRVAPAAAQERMAADLGATVRWNAFGTPHVMVNHEGYLDEGLGGDPATAARDWVRAHRDLFRLSEQAVADLELLRVSPLLESPDQARYASGELPDPDVAHVVLFRQTFAGLPTAQDGLLNLGIDAQGRLTWVSSTTTGDAAVNTTEPAVSAASAYRTAAADVGRPVEEADLGALGRDGRWVTFDGLETAAGTQRHRARLVAMPTPTNGVRLAWETLLLDNGHSYGMPATFTHFVDAVDGAVLFRSNDLQHLAAVPPPAQTGERPAPDEEQVPARWTTFPAYPSLVNAPVEGALVQEGVSEDTRQLWCWNPDSALAPECDRTVGGAGNTASPFSWDSNSGSAASTSTTDGNNAETGPSFVLFDRPESGTLTSPRSTARNYTFDWTNQWYQESCNPESFGSPQRNDIDAATVSLNVGHNRIHDWGYYLGWTEVNSNMQKDNFGLTEDDRAGDPETGQSQAGSTTGTITPIFGRDNANQGTPPDGQPGITNQYLWQPISNAVYVPCVDGAYDQSVISHEVGHAIQNRMTAGPDARLDGFQARAMGESWSDLTAIEYLNGFGFTPIEDENVFAVGGYVTGDRERGIRNYAMNDSPLNYSNVGYDFIGPQVHADGEIWSATHFAIRQAMIAKFDAAFRAEDQALQVRCAEGQLASTDCPGNRRWIQLIHDGFLMQPSQTDMVDSRDAILAADRMRYGGENQELLWSVFAQHGLGEGAASPDFTDASGNPKNGVENMAPTPGFTSPLAANATVKFAPVAADGGAAPELLRVFIGDYEARSRPVADTDPETELSDATSLAPGTYSFFVVAPGFGGMRFTETVNAGEQLTFELPLQRNAASLTNGAEAVEGDGVNLDHLIDDTEATNWAVISCLPNDETQGLCESADPPPEPDSVAGRQITVRLAGEGAQRVSRAQVSAQLRVEPRGSAEPDNPDRSLQNRFSALRAFEILACNAEAGADCATDDGFAVAFTSPEDAFPGVPLRPRVSDLTLRSFDLPPVEATHLRLRVLTNQCTGQPQFQGKLDADPENPTDCATENGANAPLASVAAQGENVRAAELQAFNGPAAQVRVLGRVAPEPPSPEPTEPPAPAELRRVAGLDRVATAIELSTEGFAEGTETVVLARADDFPDALAAATLAAEVGGPVLLTDRDELDRRVAEELERLNAATVYLAGGVAALSPRIESELEADGLMTERMDGVDRFETAALIADEVVELGGPVRSAIVVRADEFVDALAAGNVATTARAPILLTPTDELAATTAAALDELLDQGDRVIVAGGEQAVDGDVERAITDAGYGVDRLAGGDRYATARVLVSDAVARGADPDPSVLASGVNFPDALTAVPTARALGGVMLLVDPADLSDSAATEAFITDNAAAIRTVLIAGGPEAISQEVADQVAALLAPS